VVTLELHLAVNHFKGYSSRQNLFFCLYLLFDDLFTLIHFNPCCMAGRLASTKIVAITAHGDLVFAHSQYTALRTRNKNKIKYRVTAQASDNVRSSNFKFVYMPYFSTSH
jgi:hypothetical protein